MTVIGWQAGVVATAVGSAGMISGITIQNYPDYNADPWKVTLLCYATIILAIVINGCLGMLLPAIETMIFLVHTFGFLAVLIPLVYFAPHGSAKDVFATFVNAGNWQTQGLSFMVGLPYSMVSFVGEQTLSMHR